MMKCPACGTSKGCYDCGGCPEHCECEDGFVECTCVRVDVDLDDARDCQAHGPQSKSAKEAHRREAQEIWESYNGGKGIVCPF